MALKFVPLSVAASMAIGLVAAPASAAVSACPASMTTNPASTCVWVTKNALNDASVSTQNSALETLLGVSSYSVDWSKVDPTKSLFSYSAGSGTSGTLNFSGALFGPTVIGIHFGKSNSAIGNSTAFFLFDFTKPTSSIDFSVGKGYSAATLYSTGTPPPPVPEPATWALMILGFGAVGGAVRRSKKTKIALTYA